MSELLGMRNLADFLMKRSLNIELQLDATAAKAIAHRQGAGGIKHLEVRTLWIQECILLDKIEVHKIDRSVNWSDRLCSVPKPPEWRGAMAHLSMAWTAGPLQ